MILGVPKEIKNHEYRVGLLPQSVEEVVKQGHSVLVESGCGLGIDISDAEYEHAGATVVNGANNIFDAAELIIKVKEPTIEECDKLSQNQILFTFLHLAPIPEIAAKLVKSKITALAYETVTNSYGNLPLLTPMSEVAGKVSIQIGAYYLEKNNGGRGVLLGGVTGTQKGNIVIIGGGVVGSNALKVAVGIGANVTILDKSEDKLNELENIYDRQINTECATAEAIAKAINKADLVIGAVLVPGASAPKIITRDMLKDMRNGTVIIDVAIDQGGCTETSKATTYSNPTFIEEGVIHYCVSNMPSAVPRTSAFALNNVTLPFIIELANKGLQTACIENKNLAAGINVYNGFIVHPGVAKSLSNLPFKSGKDALRGNT